MRFSRGPVATGSLAVSLCMQLEDAGLVYRVGTALTVANVERDIRVERASVLSQLMREKERVVDDLEKKLTSAISDLEYHTEIYKVGRKAADIATRAVDEEDSAFRISNGWKPA
jgi:hypothetical protein